MPVAGWTRDGHGAPTDPGDFPRELLAFPNGEHDDFVDAAVYAADLGAENTFYFTAGRRF